MNKTDLKFKEILKESRKDPHVIGVFLTGSRGKGFEGPSSDYDLNIIVKDASIGQSKKKYFRYAFKDIDLIVKSLSEFKKYAKFGSSEAWDSYSFAHVKPMFDKNGTIVKIIKEKGIIPAKYQTAQTSDFLDIYLNAVYRSVKYFKINLTASRFEAVKSMDYLVGALFALEGRTQPYYGYLEKELANFPLKYFPWKPKEFIKIMLKILDTADLLAQRRVFGRVEKLFRKHGFGKNFDAWRNLFSWIKKT
jgi:hypothetical protein